MKKSRKPLSPRVEKTASSIAKADHGTPERWHHSGRIWALTDRAGLCAARALDTDCLDRLVIAGLIEARHREAGLRLRADFQAAGMGAHLVGSYNPVRCGFSVFGGWDERSDAQEEAYARWRKAVQGVGSSFSDLVISVVCYDETPSESQIGLLAGGLVKLVRYYEKNGVGRLDQHVNEAAAGQVAIRRTIRVQRQILH